MWELSTSKGVILQSLLVALTPIQLPLSLSLQDLVHPSVVVLDPPSFTERVKGKTTYSSTRYSVALVLIGRLGAGCTKKDVEVIGLLKAV